MRGNSAVAALGGCTALPGANALPLLNPNRRAMESTPKPSFALCSFFGLTLFVGRDLSAELSHCRASFCCTGLFPPALQLY